jgi:hypothetical protein
MLTLWLAAGLLAKRPAQVTPETPPRSGGSGWVESRPRKLWSDIQRETRERQALIDGNNIALIFAIE